MMRIDTFGAALRHYRKAKGLSQLELSKMTDLKQGAISRYENLINAPNNKDSLLILSQVLDVQLADLKAGIIRSGPTDRGEERDGNEDERESGRSRYSDEDLRQAIRAFEDRPELITLLRDDWDQLPSASKDLLLRWLRVEVQLSRSRDSRDGGGTYPR